MSALEWLRPLLDAILHSFKEGDLFELLGGLDLRVADWVDEFRNYATDVLDEVFFNNCAPETQGY